MKNVIVAAALLEKVSRFCGAAALPEPLPKKLTVNRLSIVEITGQS